MRRLVWVVVLAGCTEPPPPCGPTGGGPYWVEEGTEVTARLDCSTGRELTGDAFTFATLPRGATYDPSTATLTWTPGLDQADVHLIAVSVGRETSTIKIGVADKFDDRANVPIADPRTYTEEFGLPVFHIKTTPALEDNLKYLRMENNALWADPCAPVCVPDTDSPLVVTYRGRVYEAEGHYRGASSLGYPKKNYTIKFPKGNRFTDGKMVKRHALALITPFDDNSYIRWRMAFELWNRMDPAIIRVEHFSAVVYVDGKYHGLYTVADKIDNDMMERAGLSKDGNLFMGIDHNSNFDTMARQQSGMMAGMVRPRRCAFEGFTKKEGLPEKCNGLSFVPQAFDDLVPFLNFVSTSADTQFLSSIERTVVLRDYYDWFIHGTAIVAGDSYAKNALHYHDPVSAGPWRVVVWDYNASFGQAWNTVRAAPTASPIGIASSAGPPAVNNIWRRLWTNPTYNAQMRARYATALKTIIKIEDVHALFDGFVNETAEGARRDERKWAAQYRTFYGPTSTVKRTDLTTYAQEIPYLRGWLSARWAYLKTQFP